MEPYRTSVENLSIQTFENELEYLEKLARAIYFPNVDRIQLNFGDPYGDQKKYSFRVISRENKDLYWREFLGKNLFQVLELIKRDLLNNAETKKQLLHYQEDSINKAL